MEEQFNFFHHWYPLSPVEDLDPQRPTPVTLLGLNLVIWKPRSSSTYQVFLDQCPHRLAPLSEGRIDEKTGQLMCSYHGWQFNQEGICTRIPQAEKPDLIEKNQNNFACISLPCREINDLLWVWPDVNSKELAKQTPLPLSPQIDANKGFVWSSFVRDLAYDWQTLVENVADPSHVPFTHHGVQGNRDRAEPIPIEIIQSTPSIIEVKAQGRLKSTITFEPPNRLEYAIKFGKKAKLGLVTYCIPVSPGKSRLVAQFSQNFAKTLHSIIPRWWTHIKTRNLVLDGDMIVLHQQEYFLKQRETKESWKTAYKLATSADRLLFEFRKWFDQYCGGQLPWSEVGVKTPEIAINENRQQLLDRYHQHTQHCSSCRDALKRVQGLQIVLLAFFILTVSSVAIMPDELRLRLGLPLMVMALLGLGVYSWLKWWLEPKFYFIDYIHAERK